MSDSEISPNDESVEQRNDDAEPDEDELSIEELEEAAGGIGEPPAEEGAEC